MATQGATAVASGNSENYNYEKNRLRSFRLWPYPNVVNPNELAKCGFYSTGFYMETQCNWCHTTISDWQLGDQVMARHKRSDPFCQFIVNPNGCGNISLESDRSNEMINNSNSDGSGNAANINNGSSSSSSSRPLNNDAIAGATTSSSSSSNVDNHSITTTTNNTSGYSTTDSRSSSNGESTSGEQRQRSQQQQRQQPLIGNLENPQLDLKIESNRLATFKNWPNPNVSPQSLAKAGFYYFNKSDHVQCAWCKGVIGKWEKGDDASKEHDRFCPNCPRVQLGPLIETTIIDNNSLHLSRELGIQEICPPKSAKYSCLDARMRTYSRWPIPDIQNPVILAQAGFYYQEIEDQVRCFHCHGGLRSWQKEDDPWFEHAKWFPYCSFLKLAKGPNFVSQIRCLGRSQQSQGNSNENENSANNEEHNSRQATLTSEPVINLDDAMQTEPVQRALEMGLNEGRIMSATRRYLEANGKPFDTTEELVEAVLEGQVDEEDDANGPEPSSSIVREVSIILNNIFNPRNQSQISVEVGGGYDFDDIGDFHGAGEGSSSINYFNDRSITDHSSNIDRNRQSSSTNNESQSITSNLNRDNSNSDVNKIQKQQQQQQPKETNVDEASIENNEINKTKPPLNEQQSLEEENRKLKDARTCKVCMDDEVGVVFLPCGHLVTCFQCAPGVTVCPLCRSTIKGFVRTFLS